MILATPKYIPPGAFRPLASVDSARNNAQVVPGLVSAARKWNDVVNFVRARIEFFSRAQFIACNGSSPFARAHRSWLSRTESENKKTGDESPSRSGIRWFASAQNSPRTDSEQYAYYQPAKFIEHEVTAGIDTGKNQQSSRNKHNDCEGIHDSSTPIRGTWSLPRGLRLCL